MQNKNGFTMIEMVFVIVVLGILAAIAVPKLDAEIAKGRADASAVRAAIISERQKRLITGDANWISGLGTGFTNVLMYPAGDKWSGSTTAYTYKTSEGTYTFTYNPNDGTFKCTSGNCDKGFKDFK